MRRPLWPLLALVLVVAACLPFTGPGPTPASPSATASATASPTATGVAAGDMTTALLAKPIPEADAFALVRAVKGRSGTPAAPFQPVRTSPPVEEVGSTASFWVYDFQAKRNVQVSAALRVITASAKWWVQSEVTVDPAALQASAQTFEERIYPTDRRIFGEEWSPGIDGDPRVNVIIARIPGSAAGYFSSADELPRWVNEFSAEREIIYINALAARLGTDNFHSVLAHEMCHMIEFGYRVRSAVWFNEGHAQLCERANGFSAGFGQLFLQQPDTQIDAWSDLDEGAAQHYGAVHLFLEYLRMRGGGGYELINALARAGVDTFADLDAVLRAGGQPAAEDLLADFVAANALIGAAGADAKYVYPAELRLRSPARPTTQDRVAAGGLLAASVHPQAARYVELPRAGPYRVTFTAPAATRVVPTDAHSGRSFWWSDRADGMDSALTREVDLARASGATLRFWTWFDIEDDFDYGYVAVSADGGTRWATVATAATTTTDPNGNNLGAGFTGVSGGAGAGVWIQQEADLSAFAGKKVLLRFQHVTDGALNEYGFGVDDIEIPEIGYRDDAEGDNGWDAKGFIRSTNTVRVRYIVQVIRFGARPTVERHVVEDGRLEVDVDPSADRAAPVLAVTALAVRVTDSVPFEVRVSSR